MDRDNENALAGCGPDGGDKPLDLIWGVEEIGKVIGRSYQQTYHMIASGKLPMVKQVGERYVVSRRKLIAFFIEDAA